MSRISQSCFRCRLAGLLLLVSMAVPGDARAEDAVWPDTLNWTDFVWISNTYRAGTVIDETDNHFYGLFVSCHGGDPALVSLSLPFIPPHGYLPMAESEYRSDWRVDGGAPHRVRLEGRPDEVDFAVTNMVGSVPLDAPLWAELAAGSDLTIETKPVTWRFSLAGAAEALAAMRRHCGPE